MTGPNSPATILRRSSCIDAGLRAGGIMISKMRNGLAVLLLLAAGIGMAHAQALAPEEDADAAAETAAPDAEDMADLELDWSQLNVDASPLTLGPASKA